MRFVISLSGQSGFDIDLSRGDDLTKRIVVSPEIYNYELSRGHVVNSILEGSVQSYGYAGLDDDEEDSVTAADNAMASVNSSISRQRQNSLRDSNNLNSNTTALYFPTGILLGRTATGFANSGVVGDFTFGAWVRINAYLEQYVTIFSIQKTANPGESDSYFWFGHDSQAGGGFRNRGLSVAGPNGSHCYELLPSFGTWFHAAVTKTSGVVRVYLNGVICTQDGNSGQTTIDVGSNSYNEIDRIYIANEGGFGGLGFNGAICAAFLSTNVLDATAIQNLMAKTSPLAPISGSSGSWPLSSPSDLSDRLGGTGWTVEFGNSLGSIIGPTAIVA